MTNADAIVEQAAPVLDRVEVDAAMLDPFLAAAIAMLVADPESWRGPARVMSEPTRLRLTRLGEKLAAVAHSMHVLAAMTMEAA